LDGTNFYVAESQRHGQNPFKRTTDFDCQAPILHTGTVDAKANICPMDILRYDVAPAMQRIPRSGEHHLPRTTPPTNCNQGAIRQSGHNRYDSIVLHQQSVATILKWTKEHLDAYLASAAAIIYLRDEPG
jgi:hypothetical protein